MQNFRKAAKERDIEKIYRLNKDWRRDNIKTERAKGQTNRNWIVQHKNKKFFVRLPWERTDIVDRKVEAKNILALVRCKKLAKILPKYYTYVFKRRNIFSPQEKFNLPDGTMMMEYIEGKDIDGRDFKKSNIQKALLKILHTFHTSGVKFVNTYDVFRDEILKYKNKAKKYPLNKLIKEKRIKEIEEIEKIVKKQLTLEGKLSTHNDLILENLRLGKNGKIYLLDFEYAGFNIRDGLHYDLGIILGGNLFYKNPIKVEAYNEILKKAPIIYQRKINHYKAYCGALINVLVMFWWGLIKYFSSTTREEKKYFKSYVLKRAQGIDFLFKFIKKNFKE